jgi:hypothetical protein
MEEEDSGDPAATRSLGLVFRTEKGLEVERPVDTHSSECGDGGYVNGEGAVWPVMVRAAVRE